MSGSIQKIFLYYHSDDNSTPVYETLGWVDAFTKFLAIMLKQLGGGIPTFSRIKDLNFTKKLPNNYFILIIASQKLMKEGSTSDFFKNLKKASEGNKVSGNKIIKIQKHFFPKEMEPEYLLHFKDYAFYKARGIGDTGTEYKDFISSKEEKTFWVKLADLAYELFAYSDKDSSGTLDISNYKVFLAETGFDSEKYRNNLKRDLNSLGLKVLPEKIHSNKAGQFILNVDENVKNTDFAIHIVGNHFGEKVENTDHSKDEIQAKITENHANFCIKTQKSPYKRFFWFDKIGLHQNEQISNYYKELSHKAEESKSTELVVSSWEEFKSLIYQFVSFELTHIGRNDKTTEISSNIIYFIFDASDEEKAKPYIQYLRKKGYAVITSNFEGDIMAVRHIHLEGLKRFDIAMIYASKASSRWVNMKILDILKAPGFGREKPIKQKILLISPSHKNELLPASSMFEIIPTVDDKPETVFQTFMTK